jgi:DNA-binding NtrC family response regulator
VEALSGWHVWQVLVDRHGRLWFGGALGRGVMHGDGDRFRLWDRAEDLPCRQVRLLFEDRSGTVWIGTASAGLWRWDGDDLKRLAADGSLDHVVCALQDDDGVLWFGSDGRGLFRYDGGQVTPFTMDDGLPGNGVLCLARDDEARILVGTRAGLCRFDGQTFEPVAGPLLTGTVNAALRDHAGAWWFGCAGGVTRTDGLALQTFTRDDGLVFDEVQALSQDSTGDVWIATEGGLTRCRVHTDPPRVLLDAVLADRRYEPQDKVSVSTSQKLVAFEFSGSSWTTPARRMVFVCRLEGIDDDWRFVDSGRVEYLNLPEGEYRFQVRAVDRDLNYSEPAAVQLIVEPDAIAESLSAVLRERAPQGEFVGTSATLMRVQEQLRLVAPAELTILILGETGTGKGLAARAVHEWGPRPNQPFVHVTCGAMPDSLVESELFGHERGAFTGASQRQLGKVELAAGGTLFLDEIGDLPAAAQAKLLRLLEERTFERVGGTQVLQADVRVVAATNRDLRQMIADGEFRQDLFFRLQGFEIHLPPLRERREDIPLLALYFVGPMAAHLHKPVAEISPAAEASLLRHDWPGNVRELQHAIERAVVVCTGVRIEATDLSLVDSRQTAQAGPPEHDLVTLDENERCHILRAMQETGWRISGAGGAAQLLGVPPSTLRNRMNRLHIHRP